MKKSFIRHSIRCAHIIILGGLVASVSAAQAETVIFTCQTQSGKTVRFSDVGNGVRYSYGPAGYPDLAFIQSKKSASKSCRNNPNGGFFYHGISLDYNGLTYSGEKYEQVDPSRNFMSVSMEYAVSVTDSSGKSLSRIRCVGGITDNIRDSNVPNTNIGDC